MTLFDCRCSFHLAVAACLLLACLPVSGDGLNGTWIVDESASDDFDEAGREFNRELNERARARNEQRFDLDTKSKSRNKYDAQRIATEERIRDDHRSRIWDVPESVRALLDADSLKLYQGRKIAVLYGDGEGGGTRRLLSVNPAGRAYSVSGTQITHDDVGRSLTYVEGDAIVIETDLSSGDRLVERFEPEDEAGRMRVTVRFQLAARGPWLEYERWFDREP